MGAGPPLKLQASGTVINPWYSLPPRVFFGGPSLESADNPWDITERCRIDLDEYQLQLFFQKDEITFVFLGDTELPRYLVAPVEYFLCYRTFINYNVMWPALRFDPSGFPRRETVDFKTVESSISLSKSGIADYLRTLNGTLHYALAFYLVGCENTRYFLVEYYKAVEVIENTLGGERQLLDELTPFGVDRSSLKNFKRESNDMLKAPVDIGRHAPAPGAPLYSVDLRNLLSEPRSRLLFESSMKACRQVIDAYISYLSATTA